MIALNHIVGFLHPQLDVVAGGDFPLSDTSYSPSRWIRSRVDALPGATGDGQIDILQNRPDAYLRHS